MKGPSDISDILSGLKTKTINIQVAGGSSQQQQQQLQQQSQQQQFNDSTISISDLKELQDAGNMPKKSRRRQKSDKNTLSLDI
jgi:spore coat polysaccharide biosynthesis predicted glycosyltransferase SpsG